MQKPLRTKGNITPAIQNHIQPQIYSTKYTAPSGIVKTAPLPSVEGACGFSTLQNKPNTYNQIHYVGWRREAPSGNAETAQLPLVEGACCFSTLQTQPHSITLSAYSKGLLSALKFAH
jgi:hypothetical protein